MILLSLILCGEINIAEASSITSNNHLYSRQTICTDGSKGYTKLGDINYDQQEEYERIRRGENLIRSQYKFILCEGTIFDASDEPLEVYLDGSLFSCGENNDSFFESTSECVISGGTEQVIIGLGKKNLKQNANIEFLGITFEKFTSSSIEAKGTKNSKAIFHHCQWRDFDTYSIFNIELQKVDIFDATVTNGIAQSLFVNNGGELYLHSLMVMSIDASAITKTSKMGESLIEYSTFTSSYINQIMLVSEGRASQTIRETKLFDMTFLGNIFKVKDSSSSSMILSSRGMLDQVIERSWRDEHITVDNILTANIKFNHLHQTANAQKVKAKKDIDNLIGDGSSCGTNAIAVAFDASVKIKNPQMKDRKLTAQIFDSAHDGSLLLSHVLLDTV